MKRKIVKKVRRALGLNLYQRKRVAGTEERWKLISANLAPEDRSLLDVGCNLGTFTSNAAVSGRTAIGLDVLEGAIARARRRYAKLPGLAFMQLEMTPQTVTRLPSCDAVLCLSVHHYWIEKYGPDQGWSMVGEILRKARRKFFFEPASIHKKFGPHELDFVDLDRESLVKYNIENLQRVAGPDWRISLLGETECLNPEPFRLLFLATARQDGGAAETRP